MKKVLQILARVGLSALMFLTVMAPSASWARATSATANIFWPAMYSPYFTVNGSHTLDQWKYALGFYLNYSNNPLEVGLAGARRFGIIDHLLITDLTGAVGITDWFQIGLGVPVAVYEDFNDVITGGSSKIMRMMDLRFETKFRLVDIDKKNVGVAFVPYLFIPTGAGNRFVGNNSFAGGVKAVVDFDIKDRVQISTNLGYMMRDRVVILGTEQDDQLTYGVGVNIRTGKLIDVIAEVHGATNATDLFGSEAEMPLEADGGLRIHLPKPVGLALTVGGGAGLTFGYGSPDIRAFVGLTYPTPTRDLPEPPAPPVEEPIARVEKTSIVITKKIHFEFDKAVIRPVSFRILDAVVDIIKQNPDIRKVRVEGHCDAKGTDAYNMRLSQRRSDAVRDYLIAHGIEANRLVAVGYGESRPVADNESAEGRARNRRVEFTILEQEGVAVNPAP